MIIVFLVFLWLPGVVAKSTALLISVLVGVSDYLDGYYARKYKLQTIFGQLMDPLADKIFICSAFIAYVGMNIVPAWIVVLIISREFLVTGLRLIALTRGRVIEARGSAKHKTVYQLVAINAILLRLGLEEGFGSWNRESVFVGLYDLFIQAMIYLVVFMTVWSGVQYLLTHKDVLIEEQ